RWTPPLMRRRPRPPCQEEAGQQTRRLLTFRRSRACWTSCSSTGTSSAPLRRRRQGRGPPRRPRNAPATAATTAWARLARTARPTAPTPSRIRPGAGLVRWRPARCYLRSAGDGGDGDGTDGSVLLTPPFRGSDEREHEPGWAARTAARRRDRGSQLP